MEMSFSYLTIRDYEFNWYTDFFMIERFIVYVRALLAIYIYTPSLAEGACKAKMSLWALQVCRTDA